VEEKPEGEPYFDPLTGLWRNLRTHYFGLELFWNLTTMPWYDWIQNLWERITPWMERAKPFHSELLNVKLKTLFDFGDVIFRWNLAHRRELRTVHAVWSMLPRFDLVPADAIPLDWRPWNGYLRSLMTARTTGRLMGVSHLDMYLRFDHIPADFIPLDTVMQYVETDFPPILQAFYRREKRAAYMSIATSRAKKATRRWCWRG
jgi:hypothetical protein